MPIQKLELTWIGKENEHRLEPRILIENPEYSYNAPDNNQAAQGLLIHGDNLLALKALEQDYANKVKCIYIDPPYNTGSAFQFYNDDLPHSKWLSMMYERLVLLKKLLTDDGFICVHIDDSEGHYLKALMDEVFGRTNYQTTLYIRVRYPDKTLKQDMSYHKEIEYIHVYRKAFGAKPRLNQSEANFDKYTFYFKEIEKGQEVELGGKKVEIFQRNQYQIIIGEGTEDGRKEIWATGSILDGNSSGRFFRDYLEGRYNEDGYGVLYKIYGIGDDKFDFRYFTGPQKVGATKGKYFQGVPMSQLESEDNLKYSPINNFYDLAGSFGNCRTEGGVEFRSGKKPEALIKIIMHHFSNPGDLVLDSFLGSASTIAVAHKMGRRWIGIELGNHAVTHCVPRLRAVCNGSDQGGISKAVAWAGGGNFRYYTLAPSLLEKDNQGQAVISAEYNATMLAAAVAKIEGFRYTPDEVHFWKQSHGNDHDYLFVTTQYISRAYLAQIAETMQPQESLLICCMGFESAAKNAFPSISLKKIPKMLENRCEFGREDYSFNIVNLPFDAAERAELGDSYTEDVDATTQAGFKTLPALKNKTDKTDDTQGMLF